MATERTVAYALVNAALTSGFSVSVNDGEEWVVRKSTDEKEIRRALWYTDEDVLVIRDQDGIRQGRFHLVYGNSAEELIADHTDNQVCRALVREVESFTRL